MFGVKLDKYDNVHPLEVVDSGSETQLQVGENSNYLIYPFKGHNFVSSNTFHWLNAS